MKPPVRPLRPAFPRKLPARRLLFSFERIDPGGIGKCSGHVFLELKPENFAPVLEAREGDAGDAGVGEGLGARRNFNFPISDTEGKGLFLIGSTDLLPALDELPARGVQFPP